MYQRKSNTPASTVAILTNFQEFNPGYSLTGIVVDQAHMLAREGHAVFIYVNETYNPQWEDDSGLAQLRVKYEGQIEVVQKTKFMHLKDYASLTDVSNEHIDQSKEAAEMYYQDMSEKGVETIFTHDFVFTGWNLPYALAMQKLDNSFRENGQNVQFLHWIHSVPSGARDWWDMSRYKENHSLVFPNKTEIMRVAESYKTHVSRVEIIPHIKDIRTWYDFGEDAMRVTEEFPNIMRADVLQVYPCSTDRLAAKQLHVVLEIFAAIKRSTHIMPFVIVANQWATGRQRKEDVNKYIKKAEGFGLKYGQDFVFTSEIDEKYGTGISKRMLRELQLLSNVFIFPTREESFGLVGPEASFSGALSVINRSLTMQFEVMSEYAPAFDFGSFHQETPQVKDHGYINAVALAIVQRIYQSEALMTKLYCQKRYNMDSIYQRYYLPLFHTGIEAVKK